MLKTLMIAALAGGSGFVGWMGGSIWPAPPEWTDAVNRTANDVRARLRLENVSFDGLRELMPADKFDAIKHQIEELAVATGNMITVDHEMSSVEEQMDNLALDPATAIPITLGPPAAAPAPPAAPTTPTPTPAKPEADVTPAPVPTPPSAPPAPVPPLRDTTSIFAVKLELCPGMEITNAPKATKLDVTGYHAFVQVKAARIATFPAPGACLSSGFGERNMRLHKGLDYHANIGVPVLAGGDGTIAELKYREDYGNMILIDHGGGVYTRYAHLASFARGLSPGVTVHAGDALGLMGNTAAYQIPMHLHYELLVGDYNTPKASFGLTPENPMDYPIAQ